MVSPYIGEIRMFAGNFAPRGWAFCNGQTLSVSENNVLFSLLGTLYGGNGNTTFQLPDLRGRAPMYHEQGAGLPAYFLGESSGSETETLTVGEIPQHTHAVNVSGSRANYSVPEGKAMAAGEEVYDGAGARSQAMNANSVGNTGNSQPHNNMQPYLCLSFIIALEGVFPNHN